MDNNILEQFEKDFRAFLENTYNSSQEQDEVKKLDNIEKEAAVDYVDRYLLETDLIAGDVAISIQHVLNDFIKSKAG